MGAIMDNGFTVGKACIKTWHIVLLLKIIEKVAQFQVLINLKETVNDFFSQNRDKHDVVSLIFLKFTE